MELSWLCVGDFNEIVRFGKKKKGGASRREQMVDFRGALDFVASTIWVLLAHHSPGVTTNLMGKLLGSG